MSYESRDPLRDCLDSLLPCRDAISLEVVVVDNASTDGTVEMLARAYPWVRVIANAENRGFTAGVNQGVEASGGALILVLNPDCVVTLEALEHLLAALASEPRPAAVAPALLDNLGNVARSCGRFPNLWTLFCDHLRLIYLFPESGLFGRYKYGGKRMGSLSRVDWASGAALLVPREAWLEIGGLDENIFMYMEEVDWCRRAARIGRTVHYVPEARIRHLGQRSSRRAPVETYLHNLRSRVYYFRKHHGPLAALAAGGILGASLLLKWLAILPTHDRRSHGRMYVAGMRAVWTMSWR